MKRFEKQAAQHQLLREAAFAVVRRTGPQNLSRRGLAAELGAAEALGRRVLGDDVRLPTLAAAECESRRRPVGRRGSPVELLVPGSAEEVDVEVVWLRLLVIHGAAPATRDGHTAHVDGSTSLGERYQLVIHDRVVPTPPPPDRGRADRETDRAALAPYLDDHATERRSLVRQLTGERHELVEPVHALVDGLVLAVCTARLSSDAARVILVDHLARLTGPHGG